MSTASKHHNEDALSIDEHASVEAARGAFMVLKKTFETWVTVGRGLHTLSLKAERIGDRQAFRRLREQANLGDSQLAKATVTRLLQIIENLPEVEDWRRGLTQKQQFEWSSPSAVFKHCPVFAKSKDGKPKKKTTAKETTGRLAELAARNEELEQELAGAREFSHGSSGTIRDLHRMNGAQESEIGDLKTALGQAPKTLADLRERSIPLLLALTKEERMNEITDLIRAVGLNIRDWVTTVSFGAAKPRAKKRKTPKVEAEPCKTQYVGGGSVVNEHIDVTKVEYSSEPADSAPIRRSRGRPPGSKNRPKQDGAAESAA